MAEALVLISVFAGGGGSGGFAAASGRRDTAHHGSGVVVAITSFEKGQFYFAATGAGEGDRDNEQRNGPGHKIDADARQYSIRGAVERVEGLFEADFTKSFIDVSEMKVERAESIDFLPR